MTCTDSSILNVPTAKTVISGLTYKNYRNFVRTTKRYCSWDCVLKQTTPKMMILAFIFFPAYISDMYNALSGERLKVRGHTRVHDNNKFQTGANRKRRNSIFLYFLSSNFFLTFLLPQESGFLDKFKWKVMGQTFRRW